MSLENVLNRTAINGNTKAIRKLTEKISNINTSNGAGISLEEYRSMKYQIMNLKAENWRLKRYFDRIKLPYDLPIIPESIETFERDDLEGGVTAYRIQFDVDRRNIL